MLAEAWVEVTLPLPLIDQEKLANDFEEKKKKTKPNTQLKAISISVTHPTQP